MKQQPLDPVQRRKLAARKKLGRGPISIAPHRKAWWPDSYSDYRYSCCDCGNLSIWTAEAQKTYLERWNKSPYHVTIRCSACQRLRRQKINENNRKTAEGLQSNPSSKQMRIFPNNMKHLLPSSPPA